MPVSEQGFLPTANENVAVFSTFLPDLVANCAPLAPPPGTSATHEGLPLVPNSGPSTAADHNSNGYHHLLGQLAMADDREQRQAKNAEVTWGMSPDELHQRYVGHQLTLAPMPSGLEGSGQIVTGLPLTPPIEYMPTHTHATVPAPYGPPPGIDTSCR
jgi:hypothetical protein